MSVINLRTEIQQALDNNPQWRELLFRRGYLLTNVQMKNLEEYPFYGLWREIPVNGYHLYVQREQTCYRQSDGEICAVIVGHAYNPFDMTYDENDLCADLVGAYKKGKTEYFDKVSEFTGLHVIILADGEKLWICQDACSLTGCFFGNIGTEMYVSEHAQLIADIKNLTIDETVEKLVSSRCYNIGNRHLPGNLSSYKEVRRLGANTYLQYDGEFQIARFFPTCAHPEYTSEQEKQDRIEQIGSLVHNGIECCTKKWDRCAISLSGGTDSKTTLACANGLYDKLSFFSFYSKPQELVDAKGARQICSALGLEHTLYEIPENNDAFEEFGIVKSILQHNIAYIQNLSDNEIRKYIFLHRLDAYDIELKSWASEVARVFFERKYEIRMPEVIHERICSIFQTRFFGHPGLLRWSDRTYYRFLREIGLEKPLFNYEHTDLIYWEIRMGCWGVSVISSQQLYHRVTIPMNNRKILDLFLGFPHEERKTDSVHKRIMKNMNQKVVQANVEIPNLYFHKYRIWLEKAYFFYRTLFYRPMK